MVLEKERRQKDKVDHKLMGCQFQLFSALGEMEELKLEADVKRHRVEIHQEDFDQLYLQKEINHLESAINKRDVLINELMRGHNTKQRRRSLKDYKNVVMKTWDGENLLMLSLGRHPRILL